MAPTNNKNLTSHQNSRYEYRVWGKHRQACKHLANMASTEVLEEIEDCYLLIDDDEWNAKVRNSRLKVKQRVGDTSGFERWTSRWHTTAVGAPAPFDAVFKTLRLDRPQQGKRFDLAKAIARLDESDEARAVFVTKHRRRFQVDAVTAEIAKIHVHDPVIVLHSIAMQGDCVEDLRSLLAKLGLGALPNIPMHVAIEAETNGS